MNWTDFISLSISLFFLMDPLGNLPLYIATLKGLDSKKQKQIIARELIIALIIIYFFAFLGEGVLSLFHISQSTLSLAGGLILFIIAIQMIFSPIDSPPPSKYKDPFIVPLAVPYIAGPTILAAVMIYAHRVSNHLMLGGAIFVAWALGFLILIFSPTIEKVLTPKGVSACEKLMGLILTLLAVQMFMEGVKEFAFSCQNGTLSL